MNKSKDEFSKTPSPIWGWVQAFMSHGDTAVASSPTPPTLHISLLEAQTEKPHSCIYKLRIRLALTIKTYPSKIHKALQVLASVLAFTPAPGSPSPRGILHSSPSFYGGIQPYFCDSVRTKLHYSFQQLTHLPFIIWKWPILPTPKCTTQRVPWSLSPNTQTHTPRGSYWSHFCDPSTSCLYWNIHADYI